MENNIYLDKVIEFLVRDTKIDYEKEEIQFPFSPSLVPFYLVSSSFYFSPPPRTYPSYKYCKSVYGLTGDEVKYVWDQYGTIIKDKIKDGR